MSEWIRSWLMSLTGAAIVCACALRLTPEGRVKPVVRLLCALALGAALLAPLREPLLADYPAALARWRARAREATESGEAAYRALDRDGIEREAAAYILDKAHALGVPLRGAKVSLRWSTQGVWLPESAELTGAYSAALADWLEAELGVAREKQVWRTEDAD